MSWITTQVAQKVSFLAATAILLIGVSQSVSFAEPADSKLAPGTEAYLNEVFGSPVHSRVSDAEKTFQSTNLMPPLPQDIINNGPAPVPHDIRPANGKASRQAIASASLMSTLRSRELLWPMRGGLVSSRFGMRWGRMHQGTDISAPMGTPILAAADGKVVFSGWQSGYGNLVIVDHGNGTKTKYGHCSKLLVSLGEVIHQGDILGKVGSTGHSTGPHLHYEVVREGTQRNPENFTRRR